MATERIKTAIFDIETDGFLPVLTRVHCLAIRDYERRVTHRFRYNDVEDSIDRGLDMLEDAELVVGHNILHFDLPALDKVYVGFEPRGRILDTLVMSRMVFAHQKELDFRLHERGKLPGKYIGLHKLEAWGMRLGLQKGEYTDVMREKALALGITDEEEIARFTWAKWNQEMDDYCALDVDVTTLLHRNIDRAKWASSATVLEHTIHDLMGKQERNGVFFNVPEAEKLAQHLYDKAEDLSQIAINHYGKWWAPARKRVIRALWDDPDGVNKAKSYASPRPEFGEDSSRAVWAEVTVPPKNIVYKYPLRANRYTDGPFCAVEMKEFNPNSRQQIVDRFTTVYKWNPVDFTESGAPEVSDDVLRKLIGHIPMAEELAEVFYYKKRLGQVATGKNAWLKKVSNDGRIHGYVNVGGTVSGRASHVSPNLAQVPKVKIREIKQPDGTKLKTVLWGREGDHGADCRSLFYVPDGWTMVGCDLSGIELRCFGEQLAKYDGGAYLELVLTGDIHTYNQSLAELPTRDNAKTFIYALIYGAGDIKLGSIVAPLADEEEQREIGAKLRERFMANLPAFAKVIRDIQKWARRGYLEGLDGRRLHVRSPHSALNTKLQSDAALIAKKWVCLTEDRLLDAGLGHSWDEDFTMLLWIHDEIQMAVRSERKVNGIILPDFAQEIAISSAALAGKHFGYSCPVDAEAKKGRTWQETH